MPSKFYVFPAEFVFWKLLKTYCNIHVYKNKGSQKISEVMEYN